MWNAHAHALSLTHFFLSLTHSFTHSLTSLRRFTIALGLSWGGEGRGGGN